MCGVAIVLAGSRLSLYGKIIGEKLKIGSTWIGLVLLAAVTSMPEMITSCTAGAIGASDIALSNIFGSNIFNIAILGIIGLLMPKRACWEGRGNRHLLSGGFSMLVTGVVIISVALYGLAPKSSFISSLGHIRVGVDTTLIMALYLLAMYVMFMDEKGMSSQEEGLPCHQDKTGLGSGLRFAAASIIIVGAGYRMVILGDILANTPISLFGTRFILGQNVVGTFFLSIATSLPELTVCFAAVRMGLVDMAIGNIFGSNIFNVAALFFADLFFSEGALLSNVSHIHIMTGTVATIMSIVFLIGSTYEKLFVGFRRRPLSAVLVGLWLGAWVLVFLFGRG